MTKFHRILAAASIIAAASLAAPAAHAVDADIAEGDKLFAARTATAGAAEALEKYEAAFSGPDAAEAKWKAARALHWLGDQSARKREKSAYFEKGIEYGKAAVKAASDSPDAHFWLAALYGSYGEARGVLKSLSLVGPIREELRAVNRIDERYQGGAGHRVLGIVDYKVPGFAGGSNKRARQSLTKALELEPDNPYNNFYMAEFLVETGHRNEAVAYLEKVAAADVSPDVDAPDLASIKEKAAALRKKIKK
jgi:hypothetical protein